MKTIAEWKRCFPLTDQKATGIRTLTKHMMMMLMMFLMTMMMMVNGDDDGQVVYSARGGWGDTDVRQSWPIHQSRVYIQHSL